MRGDIDVEHLGIAEDLHARIHQLEPHGDGEDAADDPADQGEDQVHRADVLVVGRVDPAAPTGGMIFVVGFFGMGVICHGSCFLTVLSVSSGIV